MFFNEAIEWSSEKSRMRFRERFLFRTAKVPVDDVERSDSANVVERPLEVDRKEDLKNSLVTGGCFFLPKHTENVCINI